MSSLHLLSVIFAGLFGACVGSFFNVVAIRWHREASLGGRSICPQCGTPLKARHLVPILSWLALGGRCATCRSRIHPQYPLVEAAAAVLFAISAGRWDPSVGATFGRFLFEAAILSGLLVPIVMDLRWQELPLEWLMGLSAVAVVLNLLGFGPWGMGPLGTRIGGTVLALFVAVLFFGAQWRLSRGRWLGEGDVWFGAFMGLALGWPLAPIGIYLSYLAGGVLAGVGLATGALRRGQRVAFGPILALGTALALWTGDRWLAWLGV